MDDLLDLNWSSSPNSNGSGSTKQGNPSLKSAPSPSPSSFDFLSVEPKSGAKPNYYSSTPTLRPSTPSSAPIVPSAKLAQPLYPASGRNTPQPPSVNPPPQIQGDAFSSLLSLGSSSSNQNVSLAEKQRQIAEEKARKAAHERAQFEAHGAFWDNLGSSSSNTTSVKSTPPTSTFDDLLSPQTAPISRPSSVLPSVPLVKSTSTTYEDNGDDDFLAGPSTIKQPVQPPDPFDFDALDSTLAPPTNARNGNSSSGMRTPVSDFDFGDKAQEDDDDDDLLGELGRPSKPLSAKPETSPPRETLRKNTSSRSTSPPPHVVGQIVEMGFTPSQARQALAKTSSGVDVEAALESLLVQNRNNSDDEDRILHEQRRREEEEKEKRRRRRAGPTRDSVKTRTREEQDAASEYSEQAERLKAQASEFGQNVLSRATMFWNAGKEKAMKAYEEQRKALEADQRGKAKVTDGRPKWMVDAQEEDAAVSPLKGGDTFKDSDEETTAPSRPEIRKPRAKPKPDQDLLFGDAPKSYQPAHRRPTPTPSPQPSRPPPPTLIKRSLVSASSSQIASSSTHKAKGNEHFKLGRFPEAESAYSSAISSLPESHLLLVPLYNNRAATRLKLGQSGSAVEDCTTVIDLVGISYHPSKEAPLPADLSEVKLGDALVKAMIKRAQGWEMAEKWMKAVEDWEKVMGLDAALLGANAAATRNQAAEGARRAKSTLEGGEKKSAPAPPKPSRPVKPVDTDKSAAVGELRKAAQAAEAEDAQRLALKDSVDAKVQAWKGGKETNLRALIASLDTILWDDILKGGLKVGMHELIQEKQVKIKYLKVIARLHPDKLDVKGTTVEQRMLANAAFSALNDAWQAFNNP